MPAKSQFAGIQLALEYFRDRLALLNKADELPDGVARANARGRLQGLNTATLALSICCLAVAMAVTLALERAKNTGHAAVAARLTRQTPLTS